MKKEEWKEVESFPNYEISPVNGIRNKKTQKLIKGRNWVGYPKVTLMRDGKKHERRIHKLVAEHYVPKKNGLQTIVNHIDSDRSNYKAKNLEYMTQSENMLHRWRTDREGRKKKKYEKEYDTKRKNEMIEEDTPKALNKFANAKHKGIFYWINKNKKMGKKPKPKGFAEKLKTQRAIKKAKRIVKSRGK